MPQSREGPRKLTTPEVTWEVTKILFPDQICDLKTLCKQVKVSDLKMRGAMQWLVRHRYAVRNGNMIGLTELGKRFHDRRKELLDN